VIQSFPKGIGETSTKYRQNLWRRGWRPEKG